MKVLLSFLILTFFFANAQAQEIEATLSGNTEVEGFSVKNFSGTSLFRINGLGNVGIGTTNPTTKLQLGSFSSGDVFISLKSAGGNQFRNGIKLRQFNDLGGGFDIVNDERGGSLGLNFIRHFFNGVAVDSATALFIDKLSGNVGIGTTIPEAKLDVVGNVKIVDGTQGESKVLTSDVNGNASWSTQVSAGSYTPVWTNIAGFTNIPNNIYARYTRVGDVVTVVASFDFTVVTAGIDNKAYISLPPGLPVAGGNLIFLVSGVFANHWYINNSENRIGIVGFRSSTTVHIMLQDATVGGAATSWCNFSYVTDAP